ncbi:splicing factor, CC1-like protein [Aspergillus pseudoustus]|uniref:Splicing factor, CC1-like protein n=1 Tax=Aspergillus pseudoustus TaxID=1810923 RepID=A0ABR4IKU2_9EURO
MSGLDVEALLESTAAPTSQDDRSKTENSDRRDERDRSRDRERRRRDRSRDRRRSKDANGDDDMKSPRSEHGSANGSHRSRKRSRSRDSDRRRARRDRHGDDYRSNGDFYRGGGRARTRSRSPYDDRYYRPSGRSRRDERDEDRRSRRDRDTRKRSRSGSQEKTPELNEDERDRRTIFVQQLAARLRTKELITFFEKIGPVKEAQIVKDRVSGRSKGVGYVEFKDESSVAPAIQLTGQKLLGIPIIAQLTEAEKNRQARNSEASSGNKHAAPFHRLYVGNIHFSIDENDLQSVFEPFGELEFVQLQKDETGRSRGYGFVQFRDPNQAREALEKMNGYDLGGRAIRVGLGNDKFTPENTQRTQSQGANQHNFQGSMFSGSGGRGVQAGGTSNFDRAGGRDSEKGTGASALDDTDVAGVNFNNFSRDALMRKLARTDEPAEPSADDKQQKILLPKTEAKPLPVNVNMASRCVMLRNMFDPTEEEGEVWIKELEDDVRAECEEKYGHVVHIALDPNSQGDIYLKFDRVQGGENAIKGLNGRFFGGKQITAQPVVDAVYSSLFSRTKAI